MFQRQVGWFTNNAGVFGLRGTDQVWCEFKRVVRAERGFQSFFGQFDAVTGDSRKANFQLIAFRADGFDVNGLSGWLRLDDDWLGVEVERDAQYVGILNVEQAFFV